MQEGKSNLIFFHRYIIASAIMCHSLDSIASTDFLVTFSLNPTRRLFTPFTALLGCWWQPRQTGGPVVTLNVESFVIVAQIGLEICSSASFQVIVLVSSSLFCTWSSRVTFSTQNHNQLVVVVVSIIFVAAQTHKKRLSKRSRADIVPFDHKKPMIDD